MIGHIPDYPPTAQHLFWLIRFLEESDSRLKFAPGISAYNLGDPAWVAHSRKLPGWWVALTPTLVGIDVRVTSPVIHDPLFRIYLTRSDRSMPQEELRSAVKDALDEAERGGAAV